MKMGYFLVRYGTELTLLKLSIQILDKNSALYGIFQARQLDFLLLSGLTVKQGRLKTILYRLYSFSEIHSLCHHLSQNVVLQHNRVCLGAHH